MKCIFMMFLSVFEPCMETQNLPQFWYLHQNVIIPMWIRWTTSFMTCTLGSGGGRPRYVTQALFMIVAKLIRFMYRKQWRLKTQEL